MTTDPLTATCPLPRTDTDAVLMGHGAGGRLFAELLDTVIGPIIGADPVAEDAAVVAVDGVGVVVSTDSFVVTPHDFPGGDIGSLAVHGTVNDVAMRGARPVALTLAYIVEEGFPVADLARITASAACAAAGAGVAIVTGDTKVVERGGADGIYINTTGIGELLPGAVVTAAGADPGDAVLVSGPVGRHGAAVMAAREGFAFDLRSDSCALNTMVEDMITAAGRDVHVLRDATRGGIAAVLNELAFASGVGIAIDESAVAVPDQVAAICDVLGIDPFHLACEGTLVAVVAPDAADDVLTAMRARPEGRGAHRIGVVTNTHVGRVTARTALGATRIVDMPLGEQLPRIC
ncbi:hydrogenase expression/formation protein HypE [Glycomyces harbinensis]|uniref:Hydrogenase expression/formation protein HypE n=1 Tax=Glycomyces harbinensis TaxID=58114 RepID=A0A1G6XMQ8_9ACTN|nr:hydrogenase expression/formation protein HypE [Glycomyces harbinensis]SDD79332.1 hydrogenase expression/formation protein HypE [Glycomyces harbinensis]